MNEKITNLTTYSTLEQIVGTWIDNKPIYRKVLTGTLTTTGSHVIANLSNLNLKTVIKIDLISNNTDPISSQFYSDTTSTIRCYIIPSSKTLKIDIGSKYPTVPLDYVVILEYTKTVDSFTYDECKEAALNSLGYSPDDTSVYASYEGEDDSGYRVCVRRSSDTYALAFLYVNKYTLEVSEYN